MNCIIAATDFSAAASNAVHYAADMARAIQAELVLFNTCNIPVSSPDGVIVMPVEDLLQASEEGLEKLKSEILARTGGEIAVSAYARMGNVTEELQHLCSAQHPFAVVIGTRGKSNFEKSVFGSSTMSIIKHLELPVLCIPPGATYGKGIQAAGFACDFRDVASTVPAKAILDFISVFKPHLHILNIDYKDRKFRASSPGDSFALHQLFYHIKPEYHFIENPDIEDGINEFVLAHKLDMLITIPKRHNLLATIFKTRTTKKLINETPAPIACIHG